MPWKPSASTLCCFHFAATWLNLRLKCVSHRVAPFEVPVPLTHTRTDTHRRAHSSKSQKCFYLFVQWLLWGLWKHASLAERHKDGKYHITLNACLECESKRDVNLHYFGDDSRTSLKKIAGVLCLGQSKNEKKKRPLPFNCFFSLCLFQHDDEDDDSDRLLGVLAAAGRSDGRFGAEKKKTPTTKAFSPMRTCLSWLKTTNAFPLRPWGCVFHD